MSNDTSKPQVHLCPNCGRLFRVKDLLLFTLIPSHYFPDQTLTSCLGSRQSPRNRYDKRPLWKDLPDE